MTKQKLNGQPDVIARTSSNIVFRKERPALALIDFDTKGMPPDVASEMERLGGFWPTLLSILPGLRPSRTLSAARLVPVCTAATRARSYPGRVGSTSICPYGMEATSNAS